MTDLITISEFKSYEGITGSTEDTKLNLIIPSISTLVRNYCGKSFTDYVSTDKVEYFSFRWETPVIFPSECPIISITSLEVDWYGDGYVVLDTTEFALESRIDSVRLTDCVKFPVGSNKAKLTYKAGYATIPADLKLCLIDLVNYYLKNEHIPEKNHATFTIRHEDGKASFPDHIRRVLDLYKDG